MRFRRHLQPAALWACLLLSAPVSKGWAAAPHPHDPGPTACASEASSLALSPPPSVDFRKLTAQAAWLDGRTLAIGQAVAQTGVARWALAPQPAVSDALVLGQALPPAIGLQALSPVPGDRLQQAWALPNAQAASHMGRGPVLRLADGQDDDESSLRRLHRLPQVLLGLDEDRRVLVAERVQAALALDAVFGPGAVPAELGVQVAGGVTRWALWAPTARAVWVCVHGPGGGGLKAMLPAELETRSGVWKADVPRDLRGHVYRYLVDVWAPGSGWVRNRVTDPYSISLTANSQHSYIGNLDDEALMPAGWRDHRRPPPPAHAVDMVISELHVRDFSASDPSVPGAHRGKYLAFTHARSRGMRHLAAMAEAGLTDVHLLPIFDLATVPEVGCLSPPLAALRRARPDSPRQQSAVQSLAAKDCFNWGYDPWHFNAPEGSYATDAADPAVRILELRRMVMSLHRLGLRVGMDVVYNHTTASGQDPRSVLDRIVPGYYHRLDARGSVERSTCCDNTATEHAMMRKLMIESAVLWVRHHGIDSFRFDLMGHQPREAMLALQQAVDLAAGRRIPLIGEGWNFGEVADGARFVQASQLSLPGTGVGTFNDRLRDAARGTRHGDDLATTLARKGWLNGAQGRELAQAADLIRAGLAGSVRDFRLALHDGQTVALRDLAYGGQPAGYVAEPFEVVNYVENHDNPTLFDLNALKLPLQASALDRTRVQILGSALVALAQGVAYWHAGQEILRSKSMDLNSYDSGDWFNRLDWSLQDNGFGAGLPPGQDNRAFWPAMAPRLREPGIKPTPDLIRLSRDAHLDLLRLRSSTPLLRLPTAQAIMERVSFPGSGPAARQELIAMQVQSLGWPGSPHRAVMVLLNAAGHESHLDLPVQAGLRWELHPVHRNARAGDARIARQARWDEAQGRFHVPARSAVVFVAHP